MFSTAFLVTLPKAVDFSENKLIFAANSPQVLAPVLQGEIKGTEVKKEPVIVNRNLPAPEFSAAAVLAQDFETGEILYQKNINLRLPPASTTKLMTAIVAQDQFKQADILPVTPQSIVGGSTMGLNVGEQLTFRSLLYGMLLNSGNDAAFTIAANYPGGLPEFIANMNRKVSEMGLLNTHFSNPAGFDGSDHYSSAFDLAVIAKEAVKSPYVARIVATKHTEIQSWDKSKVHNLQNLNKLLAEEGVIGIKTGFTEKAGENFIGLVDRNGYKVITVVLNSSDRFGETKKLMDWVYENYTWE